MMNIKEKIVTILIERDGMLRKEAEEHYDEAIKALDKLIEQGGNPSDFCEEWFCLEPDYLDEMLLSL